MNGRWFLGFAIGLSFLAGSSGRAEAGILARLLGRSRNTGVVQTAAYANPAPSYATVADAASIPPQVTAAEVAQVPDDARVLGRSQNTGVVQTVAYPNPAPANVAAADVTSIAPQVTAAVVAQVPDDVREFQRYRTDGRALAPNLFNPRELEANIMDLQTRGVTGTYLKEKPRVLPSPQSAQPSSQMP